MANRFTNGGPKQYLEHRLHVKR